MLNYSITPKQLLTDHDIFFRKKGDWLSIKVCPRCKGGESQDVYTFAVHEERGSFGCLRSSCDAKGNYWELFILLGLNPRNFYNKPESTTKKKKTRFMYGR